MRDQAINTVVNEACLRESYPLVQCKVKNIYTTLLLIKRIFKPGLFHRVCIWDSLCQSKFSLTSSGSYIKYILAKIVRSSNQPMLIPNVSESAELGVMKLAVLTCAPYIHVDPRKKAERLLDHLP
jgi:hypothetical protein